MRTGSVFERLGREFSTELKKTLSHEERPKINWAFLDAVFLITCPQPDGSISAAGEGAQKPQRAGAG
jgi:hypothetical protein